MVRGVKKAILALAMAMMLVVPALAEAATKVHWFQCGDCHRSGLNPSQVMGVCSRCHPNDPTNWNKIVEGSTIPVSKLAPGNFHPDDASNAFGSHPSYNSATAMETSHYWASPTDNMPQAGALPPANPLFDVTTVSRGKVTCSRCHDPHAFDTNPKLTKMPNAQDQMCLDCHRPWNQSNNSGLETHPMVADFDAALSSPSIDPAVTYNSLTGVLDTNVNQGEVRVLYNSTTGKYMVSCTSCHGMHYTDSDSTTSDGLANRGGLAKGDGKLLRTDGTLKTVTPYNAANSTIQAQIRSNLCQACHVYEMHGNTTDGGPQIGCLDCHSGHAYNGGTPNIYVLRRTTSTYSPRYGNTYTTGIDLMTSITGKYSAPYAPTTNEVWSNKVVGIGGYCEECHGDVQASPILGKAAGHVVASGEACTTCHKHGGTGWTHSWQPDVSAATCGDCHGFPPHVSQAGNRATGGTDGGYAFAKDEIAPGNDWDYLNDSGNYKLEGTTAHITHAGYDATNFPNYYFVGTTGTENCNVCHGDGAGFNALHRDTSRAASFRDVVFNDVAKHGGALVPVYKTGNPNIWTCDQVYCHTNGGPKDNAGLQTFKTHVTPAWDTANGGGLNAIMGSGTRCSTCHGNNSATMASGQQNNSQTHIKHLDKGYTCNVCHLATASSNTALQPGATNGKVGGTHIDSIADVDFDTAYDLDTTAGTHLLTVGAPYDDVNGTCSVYCHSDGKGALVTTADWQVASTGACNTCHPTTAISSGAHTKHIAATGANIKCDSCHGTNAALGTHTGHVDGVVTVTAGVCDSCHGVENTAAWDVTPTWTLPASIDCRTCHTGALRTSYTDASSTVRTAPDKSTATSLGHNRPTASSAYPVSGNNAANLACDSCHDSAYSATHTDATKGDKRLLGGFSCDTCHGPGGTGAVKKDIYTHQAKGCTACHDPHGDAGGNIFMVRATSTGNYTGTVVFTNRGNSAAPLTAANSYDEDDDAIAGFTPGSEVNGDDICATCHTNAGSLTLHNNQQGTDSTAAGGSHNLGKNCFDCHKTHTEPTGAFAVGGGDSCDSCHGAGASNDIASQPIHQVHNNLVPTIEDDRSDCVWCHPNAGTYTYTPGGGDNHSNAGQRVTDLGTTVGYNAGDGSCLSACHASSAGDGFWGDANGLSCGACHGVDATGRPSDASHSAHVVTAGKACTECHVVNAAGPGPLSHIDSFVNSGAADDGTAISDKATATGDEATVSRTSLVYTRPTCAGGIGLGCHATGTPQWNVSTTADNCIDCHTNTTDATVNPNSGLHFNNQSPTVSTVKHDSTLTGGCEACHTTVNAQATHKNGILNANGSVAGDRTAMGLFADYTNGGANNVGTCSGATVGGASCHAGGDGGTWARKWDSSISYQSNGTECKGCHGGFGGTDWTFGSVSNTSDNIVEHNRNWDGDANPSEVIGNHSDNNGNTTRCNICHVYSDAGYTWATNHRNGQIEMNSSMGYSTGTRDCTNTCHSNNTNHNLEASGWTVNAVAGPALSCYTCHGNGSTDYWPSGSSYPNRAGEHPVHIAKLAAKLGLGAGPYTQAQQQRMCAYCHNDPTDIAGYGGQTGHADGAAPADVGAFNPLWDTVDPPTTADVDATEAGGACSNVDCHNNKATTPTYDWFAGATSACAMCHNNGAGDATHSAHLSAGMGVTIDCLSCHGAGTTSTTPPSSGHISGTLDVAGSVTFTYTGGMTGTCGTNNCHNSGRYAAGVQQAPKTTPYNWGTPIGGCDACHETTSALATGSHTAHLTTTSQSIACSNCHAAETLSSHIDAAVNFTGAAAAYNSGTPEPITDETFSTCGTNTCHNNGKNATPYNNGGGSYTWNTAIGGVNSCTECHNNGALGELHSTHLNAAAIFGINTIACDSCHTSGAAAGTHSGHVDATVTLASLGYSGTPNSVNVTLNTFGTCNTTTCHNNGLGSAVITPAWNDAPSSADDCTICHGNAGSNLTSKAHPTHIATSAQSGKAWGPYPTTGSTNCGECHAAAGTNDTMATYTTHIDGTINFAGGGNLAATSACNTCHGGATPAATAKANWTTTPTRVACESCHGDYTQADVGGKIAPSNAGTSFDSYGHGKVTPSANGGPLCLDCHDNTAAGHIDGTSGDDKRLKVVNSQNYGTDANAFCASACHATTMNAHYANANTPGGLSDDGNYCYICHNPHGQNGNQDAMIRSTIQGRTVAGFTNKLVRSSYQNASFNGVCQVCHENGGVDNVGHFNRALQDTNHPAAASTQVCTDCHDHTSATAFSASGGGCDGCHGYPPVQNSGWLSTYTSGKQEDYTGGGRAHTVAAHLSTSIAPADGWAPCTPCHTETDHNMGLGVGNLATERDNSANWGTVGTRYPRVRLDATLNKGGSATFNMGNRNTTDGMGYCSNLSCHFGESPKWDCEPANANNDPL